MQIYPFNTEKLPKLSEVGGKALSLIRTSQQGLAVPKGLALSVAFFQPWTEQLKAGAEWQALLTQPSKENCDLVKNLASKLRLSEQQQAQLDLAMNEFDGTDLFAVRSSSPEEDLASSSFAGIYETYLGCTKASLTDYIAKAYSSMFDFRVIGYKNQNNLALEGTAISVIVQKQLASDVSGVAFSLNPLNNCYDEAMINASFGLGEAIVSGIVTPDSYIVEKCKMEILQCKVNSKQIALHLKADGGIEERPNSSPEKQALSEEQILELTELVKQCESHYGFPVDTEWAYEKGKLYLLQARPITT